MGQIPGMGGEREIDMNNRYLFRGKREDYGSWVEGYYVFNFWKKNEATIHLLDGGCCIVDPTTIGQCTGHRDMNESLIFEGDILQIDDDDFGIFKSVVYWSERELAYVIDSPRRKEDLISQWTSCDLGFPLNCAEIIGNIHESPARGMKNE